MKFLVESFLVLAAAPVAHAFTVSQQPASSVVASTASTVTTASAATVLFSSATETSAAADKEKKTPTKKEKRLRMMKSDQFFRRGFKEVRSGVEETMEQQFNSDIVNELKTAEQSKISRDGVTVYLAKDFGFCWGVERSIALAYEAVEHFPNRKIHITNELIHNPTVNDNLLAMDVGFIEKTPTADDPNSKNFEAVGDGDVVILPAFGASCEEMEYFDKKNVEIVDTTCPWVSKVWNTVDKHQKAGHTSIIHGKYAHEETVATVSFCEDYICVKNMAEAEMVADYITNGGDKDAFMKYFEKASSENFDPDTMLNKIGLANQTTMYKKETRAIGQLLQKSMMKKHGPVDATSHYMEFDTICDATQERQDAVHDLTENSKDLNLDFILVVGGLDSSNTAHLLEIPQVAGVRSFHIDTADRIAADNTITHRNMDGEMITEPFLIDLEKEVTMGVTSGASTPDKAVQDSLSQIFLLKKIHDATAAEAAVAK